MTLPHRLAVVDLETTGAHPLRDRITEIAIVLLEDGREVERWSSLVRPGRPIPATIQTFTGITDAMVADAPPFDALADTVLALLDDAVFVAHNARFDFGFLKSAFAELDKPFDAAVLCTVKLSRALYPQHHRHGLDALIERHSLRCSARHRAMGDVEALCQFLDQVRDAFPADTLARAVERAMKAPSRPPGLPDGVLEGMPDSPGVYFFFGENDLPLYIGKSKRMRTRVMSHFGATRLSGKAADLVRQVRRVEWEQTAGELGALLLEACLVKHDAPLHNRQLRKNEEVFGLRLLPSNKRKGAVLERVPLSGGDPRAWADVHGAFRTRKEADNLLRELAYLYRLCPRRLGLESGRSGACMAHQMKRCAGVCAGKETPAAHDQRLAGALAGKGLKPWPWSGPVLVHEQDPATGLAAWHVLDAWCYLATEETETAARKALAGATYAFDLDIYRVLLRWFDAPAHRQAVTERLT
ncbi:exonuclease domain-containing protein [Denitromonas iodatirespirans]|uniref:DNA-directed DNA polymerase n=1 Tax=Denitromonas iodatirespirans TaxID=2795389 RepID=A0A944DF21_DENI1|nr:exonuclease domain-containing protein [Denitromonas iodatirespirans]MBT0963092.1 ethanolamine utilization protein [Denitromonas iodatirespirans]